MFIAVSLNIVKTEDVSRLLELARVGSRQLSEAENQRLVDLVSILLERIVS